MTDVCESEVIREFSVYDLVAESATYGESAVESLEVEVGECRHRLLCVIVLDFSADAIGEISACERSDTERVFKLDVVFQKNRQFQIVKVVFQFATIFRLFASLFGVEES